MIKIADIFLFCTKGSGLIKVQEEHNAFFDLFYLLLQLVVY